MVKAGNPPNPGRNFSAGGGSQQSPGPSFQLLPPFCIFFFRAAMIALKLQPNNWRKSGSDPKHSKTAYDCCQDARPPATWVPLMKSCGRICERQAVSGKGFTYGCQWLFDVYPIDCLSSLISKKRHKGKHCYDEKRATKSKFQDVPSIMFVQNSVLDVFDCFLLARSFCCTALARYETRPFHPPLLRKSSWRFSGSPDWLSHRCSQWPEPVGNMPEPMAPLSHPKSCFCDV